MQCEHFEKAKLEGNYAVLKIDKEITFEVCHKCFTSWHHYKGIETLEFHNRGVFYKSKKQAEKILALTPF
jgi:hypothetical protein